MCILFFVGKIQSQKSLETYKWLHFIYYVNLISHNIKLFELLVQFLSCYNFVSFSFKLELMRD